MEPDFSEQDRQTALSLDGSGSDAEYNITDQLHQNFGPRLPKLFASCLPKAKRLGTRAAFLYHAQHYARVSPVAVQLAIDCLHDKSRQVRYRAAGLLAASLDATALPALRDAAASVPEESRADMRAAIDAIESRNHHLFHDRQHTGKVTWNPALWSPPGEGPAAQG